jgi:hypothetical protein
MWRIDPLPGNIRNTQAANNTEAVFSMARARHGAMQRTLNIFSRARWHHTTEGLFFCVVRAVFINDNRRNVSYVVCTMPRINQYAV